MRRFALLAVLLSSFILPAQDPKKPVGLDAAAAAPPPSPPAVVWAPDDARFVWLENSAVHLYDVASRSPKKLLDLAEMEAAASPPPPPAVFPWENRRVKEQKLQWTPSGRELLMSLKGDLFLYEVDSGKWTQLTATSEAERDPKLSPDGRSVSFRRGNELYRMEMASEKVTRLTHDASETVWNGRLDWVYPEELDLGTAHWWSPDSSRIAYLQFDVSREHLYPHADLRSLVAEAEPQRYPKAGTPNPDVRVGVVSASGGPTRWIDFGDTRQHLIARLAWLPDGKHLAVQRLNRLQNRLDVVVANPEDGSTKVLLSETDPYWINVTHDWRFLPKSGRLLWTSERDGFRHIFLYSEHGKQLRRLTRGSWEVTELADVDEDAEIVWFVSTEASPLERHLYQVSLSGRQRARLTHQPGVHQISMSPHGRYYLDTFSSLTMPPTRSLHAGDGKELATVWEASRTPLEEYDILKTQFVEVKAKDGAVLHARLILPAGFRVGTKYPALVMVYGGPHAQAVRNSWRGTDWDQALAHRGFVIWQLDNRGSAGRGHAWESKLYRRFGAQELADQREGLRHLVSMGFVDERRVGIQGWSYGGFLTLYALLEAPDLFRAGVAGAPVTDWRNYDTIYTERYLGLPSENEDGYRKSSPVHMAENLSAKLLLIHNLEDDNVLFQHTLQMADALQKAGKQFELMIYPQKSHHVSGAARRHMLELMTSFFERSLKP